MLFEYSTAADRHILLVQGIFDLLFKICIKLVDKAVLTKIYLSGSINHHRVRIRKYLIISKNLIVSIPNGRHLNGKFLQITSNM